MRRIRLVSAIAALVTVTASAHLAHLESKAGQAPSDGSPLMNPSHKHWSRTAPESFRVRFETSKGNFIVEAHRSWAPRGVDRFYNLVAAGFFDDSRFFRIRARYIAQFGIPGRPDVAAVWKDRAIADDRVRQSNRRGFIAYAMTGPNTRTTQLYINLVDNLHLDAEGFAPIGRVIDGMQAVDSLYSGYDEQSGGGMRRGKQAPLFAGGNEYLDRDFPKLDKLARARLDFK
jgi:cyclophilin family peptidyl-prolyl cis-trans isomerase